MSNYLKVVFFAICLTLVPAGLFAQSDICSSLPSVSTAGGQNGVPGEVIVEQMRQRAAAQMSLEMQRANWTSKIITLKNSVPNSTLQALCIFHAELVPQPTLRVLSVRAPQELMATIEDAVKRLDVPPVGPKSVELTVHVLVASDQDETLRPVPASVKSVVDQLRAVLAYKGFFLVDTMLGTVTIADSSNNGISLTGQFRGLAAPGIVDSGTNYRFNTNVRVDARDGAAAVVRLTNVNFNVGNINIGTNVDVPQAKQIVVGKATAGDRAIILVVSAKVMD